MATFEDCPGCGHIRSAHVGGQCQTIVWLKIANPDSSSRAMCGDCGWTYIDTGVRCYWYNYRTDYEQAVEEAERILGFR